ncbi:hypothetical protein [Vibrio aphrogenes]|uniref:hypothetical protein n=1 Tax=Vibrio aphrogenes TaxID=1891186 RepID=UPI000B362434|nr:hypothetical protein [Vibrio aphrogenes]
MNTENCPNCQRQQAPFAHMCPHCGYHFEMQDFGYARDLPEDFHQQSDDFVSFRWWGLWSTLHLIGSTISFFVAMEYDIYWLAALMGVIFVLSMYSLKFNRYAFTALTVITLDPIQYWINYRYGKSRWNRPELDNTL